MIRNLKGLASAIIVAIVLGAAGASPASAASFHSEVEPTILTATTDTEAPNHVFVTPAGTVTCTGVRGDATVKTKTTETITATGIVYTGASAEEKCILKTIFGNIAPTIDFNTDECDYAFHSTGEVDIECLKPGGITISSPICSMVIPTQTGLKSVTYDNKGAGANGDVTVTASVNGIRGTATGAFCSKQGEFTSGAYTGYVKVRGFKDISGAEGEQVGVWWE